MNVIQSLAIAGVSLGIGLSSVVWWTHRDPPPAAAAATAGVVVAAPAGRPSDDGKVALLEARLNALEAHARALTVLVGDGGARAASESQPPGPPDDGEEAAKRSHQKLVDRFDGERPDPAWSARTEAGFRSDFQKLESVSKAKVLDVTCKTTMCRAEMEWASFADALGVGSRTLVQYPYSTNCSKEFYQGVVLIVTPSLAPFAMWVAA